MADRLLGKRFELVGADALTFVTVVRVNPKKRTVGLWYEVPSRKDKHSEHVSMDAFRKLNLARA